MTEERLNSPQPGIIWTYPCPVIYAKKYAGQIFFSIFYCSLSPWTCVHGSTQYLKVTLLGCGWQRRPLKRLLAPHLPEVRGKGGSERRRWRPAQSAGAGRGGVGAQLFRFACPSRSSTACWRSHCSDSHFSLAPRPASNRRWTRQTNRPLNRTACSATGKQTRICWSVCSGNRARTERHSVRRLC